MSLPAAIAIGGAGAIGLPYLLRDSPQPWNALAEMPSVHFAVQGHALAFSWPIFCVTTLVVWLLFRAARSA